MKALLRAAALRREMTAADRIPYAAHVAPSIVRTAYGDYIQAFRLGGASFESSDDGELNNWHERLNVLWRNIAGPNVALWTHVIRRRAGVAAGTEARQSSECFFADGLHTKYHHRLANETLMLNEVYLAIVHRPTAGVASGLVSKLLARALPRSTLALADALDACEKLAQTLKASLARYEPELLGVYQTAGLWCSSLLEYLGRWQPPGCCSAPKRSNTAWRQAPASARCWVSRSTQPRAWLACTTGSCLRRLHSSRRSRFHF
jgi:type IV secretion system protein VirB4